MKINLTKAAVLSVVTIVMLISGCGKRDNSDLRVDLPSDKEKASADLQEVKQTDEFGDYVLSDYNISEGKIEYVYTNKIDEVKTLTAVAEKMTSEEYNESLPAGDLKDAVINGIECKFINRTVHVVPSDYVPDKWVKNNVSIGTTEIKYDEDTTIDSLYPLQRIYWYDEEKGIAYSVESISQYYELEDMSEFVQMFLEKAEF